MENDGEQGIILLSFIIALYRKGNSIQEVNPRAANSLGWVIAVAFYSGLISLCSAQEGELPRTPSVSPSSLPPGIVVHQADTVGQVYIASDKPGVEEEPAKNVLVRVVIPENDEVIYETRSDKTGAYLIPRLKPGAYRMYIGGLRIALLVNAATPSNAQLPKVVITVLPRDLLRQP